VISVLTAATSVTAAHGALTARHIARLRGGDEDTRSVDPSAMAGQLPDQGQRKGTTTSAPQVEHLPHNYSPVLYQNPVTSLRSCGGFLIRTHGHLMGTSGSLHKMIKLRLSGVRLATLS
jgi:hypothetical protein